ncbi:hypothetical protein [Lentilactobacillus senioris]|uniref:Uncharacterized protein n=1 Tax=Lentilactobacillus senioris DSM 24302 = JCM 17472 TaxID=1423802 RepID=A0A0R2D0U5_9LACO|nr:hypothetical protein [Lentilactobacillus senioris]KRM94073.1 hypothetical protein FC56_GL000053 [Lentilactobacillus senioris DSM 24302 = JCM 17472]
MPETDSDNTPKTREEYRKQQQQQEAEFAQRDKKRVEAEREYAKTHRRAGSPSEQTATDTADYKTPQWRKTRSRLIWAIGILTVLLIGVYLILFFVN